MIDLSIGVVSYHNEKDVESLRASIARWTSPSLSYEFLVVDNAINNVGFGKGHNSLLPRLNSRYHAIVNPDVILTEDSFSKLVAFLDAHPEVGMVVPRVVDEKGNLQKVYRRELTVFDMFARRLARRLFPKRMASVTMDDADYTKPFEVPFAHGSFLVIRTELFRQLGGFDPRYFLYVEDADLCREVTKVAKIMYVPCTQVIHRWERGSRKKLKLLIHHVVSMIRYMNKWGWKMI